MTTQDADQLRSRVIESLRTVEDPEIPVNLYDLGLIYELDLDPGARAARIRMTLTTPNCPVAETIPGMVKRAVESVDGIDSVTVDLVWEPRWTRERMTEEGRLHLEFMGIDWRDPLPSGPKSTPLTVNRRKSSPDRDRSRNG